MDSEALRISSLFDGMADDEASATAELFEEGRYLMGDRVTHENDFGYSFFIVVEGKVRVNVGDEVVAELVAGDHFGEVALVSGERRNATVTAIESCRLAKIMTWDFPKLLEEHPTLAGRIRASAEKRS
jgi:CRP/FNR family cyclic AMP-dependent transcriptional regulator